MFSFSCFLLLFSSPRVLALALIDRQDLELARRDAPVKSPSSSSRQGSSSSSWTAAFYDAIARSLSPTSRDYADGSGGSGHRRRYNYPRSERPVYIEVPSSTGSGHHHSSARGRPSAGRSSRYHQAAAGREAFARTLDTLILYVHTAPSKAS